MAAIQGKFGDKAELLLEATLDSLSNPAWISDRNGGTILNDQAQHLVVDGFSIKSAMLLKERSFISFKNKKFKLYIKELNHGTDCFLHELKIEDDAIRLRECASVLDAAIKKR